jgi:hypothetical protein
MGHAKRDRLRIRSDPFHTVIQIIIPHELICKECAHTLDGFQNALTIGGWATFFFIISAKPGGGVNRLPLGRQSN